jgi:hypothetical protein
LKRARTTANQPVADEAATKHRHQTPAAPSSRVPISAHEESANRPDYDTDPRLAVQGAHTVPP